MSVVTWPSTTKLGYDRVCTTWKLLSQTWNMSGWSGDVKGATPRFVQFPELSVISLVQTSKTCSRQKHADGRCAGGGTVLPGKVAAHLLLASAPASTRVTSRVEAPMAMLDRAWCAASFCTTTWYVRP